MPLRISAEGLRARAGSRPAVLVLGATWLLLAAVLGMQIQRSHDGVERDLQARYSLRAEAAADAVASYVEAQARQARKLAAAELSGPVAGGALARVTAPAGYEAAVLLDADGRALDVAPRSDAALGKDLGSRYAHLGAARDGRVAVSDVVPSAVRAVPIVAVAVPFDTPSGRRVLSLAQDIDQTPLVAFLRTGSPLASSVAVLRDSSGATIAGSASDSEVVPVALRGADGALGTSWEVRDVARRHVVQRAVPGTGWTLTQSVRTDVLLAPVQGGANLLDWGLLLVLTGVGLAAMVLTLRWRQVAARLHDSEAELAVRAAAMAAARDEAVAANAAKSAFLAAASHEIRTPVNGVLGMLELIDDRGLAPKQRQRLAVAQRSAETLLSVLNELLDLAKAEAGRTEARLSMRPFSPVDVVDDALAVVAGTAEGKGLLLERQVPADVPHVLGDPGRVRQVLINLLGNAVKFTDSCRVAIRLRADRLDDGRVELAMEVADTGPGMSEADAAGLFTAYRQGDSGRRSGGTGLGLSISRDLATLMGGTLIVQTEPGTGSAFTLRVTLPVEAPAPLVTLVPLTAGAPARSDLRVLVVDDSEINLLVATETLAALGVACEQARDGTEAVEKATAAAYDLILLDCWMPKLNGPDAARQIRALPDHHTQPRLVALTAAAGDGDRQVCADAGMDGFITKPLRIEELENVLAEAALARA